MISRLQRLRDGEPISFEDGMVCILLDGKIYKNGLKEVISLERLAEMHRNHVNLCIHMCDEDPISREIEKIFGLIK